jgi:glucose-6-phosphate-specific signal transduction histidine kinase
MSGLNHLEGEMVNILADGNVVESMVVTGGVITLPFPAGVVHIGLPIESDLETLDITTASQNMREKQKLINHVSLVVEESTGIWCGPDADHLTEYKQRSDENYDESQRLAAGLIDLRIQATWNKNGRVFVRQSNPLPITILAALPEVNLGGS